MDNQKEEDSKFDDAYVLERIRSWMDAGTLRAGDKLPSERSLCESLGATRGYVRKALQRLEYYGIVTTLPQKGTVVERLGGKALAGMLQAVIEAEKADEDISSLMETRAVLERHAARLAAERAGADGVADIENAHAAFLEAGQAGGDTLDADHLFHLAVARSCGNSVTLSLVSFITPKIIAVNRGFAEPESGRFKRTWEEHDLIVRAVRAGDGSAAEEAMRRHMENSMRRRIST